MNEAEISIDFLRPENIEDLIQIAKELRLSDWSKEDYLKEISKDDNLSLILKLKEQTIGFIVSRLIMPKTFNRLKTNSVLDGKTPLQVKIRVTEIECEIYNIGITKGFQSKGLGKLLLNSLIEKINKNFVCKKVTLWLEVRSSNRRAIEFYRKNLFQESYIRKNYYVQPIEDALVMKRELTK